jgi:DNA-binding MarR family transcriptional regulator
MPEQGLSRADYEALAAFRHKLRRFLAFSEEAARAAGLTPQHHQALLAIKGFREKDKMTVGDLAECLLIRRHSAVELIDRLSRAGLVRREPDRGDQRRVLVSLTEAAEAVLHRLTAAHVAELRRMRPVLQSLFTLLREKV